MRHYTKTLAATALISGCLLSGTAIAEGSSRAAVIDKDGIPVKSILSGECVLTKWTNGMDECASQAAPASRHTARKTGIGESKRSYIVFFDFNSSSLTASAREIIGNLFTETKSAKSVNFELTGHADRVGSDAYNLMLSEKRALAVKNQLVNLGASGGNISVSWKGESEPLVPTEDGIKEPQNRRTEIRVTAKTSAKQ